MNALLDLIERLIAWFGIRPLLLRARADRARAETVRVIRAHVDEDDRVFAEQMARRAAAGPHLLLGHADHGDYVLPVGDLRGAHFHAVAQPGGGKTRLLAQVVSQLIEHMWSGRTSYSVIIVDPKHETADLVLRSIGAILARVNPLEAARLAENLVVIRPFAGRFLTPIPGLQPEPSVDLFAHARVMVELAEHTAGARTGVRQGPAGTFALAALIANGVNFIEVPFLLRDAQRMRGLAERVPEPRLQAYFRHAYARESSQTIGGLVARFEAILGVTALRAMFAHPEPIDLRRAMAPGTVTIIDLDGAPLGAGALADAVGSLLVTRLAWAAFDQQTAPRAAGTLLMIDELARLASPSVIESVERTLVTGRWLGLSLWSAAQFSSQIPALDRLLSATTRFRAFGRTSAREIEAAATELLPVTGRRIRPRRPGQPNTGIEYMSEAEEVREWTRRIARLPQRQFVVSDRIATFAARVVRAPTFEPPGWNELPEHVRALLERGSAGVPRDELIARAHEIERRAAESWVPGARPTVASAPLRQAAAPLPDLAGRRGSRRS